MSTSASGGATVGTGFTAVDYAIFITMLAASLGIGMYSAVRSRGQESALNYLLGNRVMPPIPVVFSVVGGIISSGSLLGNPTEVYFHGTQVVVNQVGIFLGFIVIHQLILPTFYRLRLVSVNQYLVLRYKSSTIHKMATLCQVGHHLFYMGVILYGPALTLATATGLAPSASVVLMGLVCTFYMTVGGVKAVVYTDVLQTLLMFGGVLVVVVICCINMGGVGNIWAIADQGARIQFFNLDPSLFVRHTLWSTIVYGFVSSLIVLGFNQNIYQRLASISSLVAAQRVSVGFIVSQLIVLALYYFSGLVAYAVYQQCDPLTSGRIQKPDQIIPYLVMDKLGHLKGVSGIFVAAIYGAVLSSISTTGNSIACLIWEDLLKDRPYFNKMSNKSSTNVLKLLSAAAGVCGICIGLAVQHLNGILIVGYKTSGAVLGPLVGMHMAGLLTPWVNAKGAMVGFLAALTFNLWITVSSFVRGEGSLSSLPLSTDGCPENLLHFTNITTPIPDADLVTTDIVDVLMTPTPSTDRVEGKTVYDISYCYTTLFGFLIVLVVSSLVSLCTGPMSSGAVNERLTSACSARLHRWLMGREPDSSQVARDTTPDDSKKTELALAELI